MVGNTGDDITLFGLRVCPDLDTVMYTLGGGIHEEQGWGRADETFAVKDELAAYGVEPAWFGLGDRDIATHVVRTQMLDAGYPLAEVTAALCSRWGWRARGPAAADDRRPGRDPRRRRRPGGAGRPARGALPGVLGAAARRADGARGACRSARPRRRPGPACSRRSPTADVVLLPPRNPVVSIGTVLAVPGIRDAWCRSRRPGRRAVADRRRRPGARHGRPGAGRDRRRVLGRGGGPALRQPARRRAARRLAGRHPRRRRGAGRRGRRHRLPGGAAADDRRRGRHRDGPAGAAAWPTSSPPPDERVAPGLGRRTGSARSRPATTWPPCCSPPSRPRTPAGRRRRRGGHLEGRLQGRGPGRCGSTARRRSTLRDGAGGRPARARPGSCETRHGLVLAAAGVDATAPGPAPCCCCRSTPTRRPGRCAAGCSSWPGSTSPSWSPTRWAGPGAPA